MSDLARLLLANAESDRDEALAEVAALRAEVERLRAEAAGARRGALLDLAKRIDALGPEPINPGAVGTMARALANPDASLGILPASLLDRGGRRG